MHQLLFCFGVVSSSLDCDRSSYGLQNTNYYSFVGFKNVCLDLVLVSLLVLNKTKTYLTHPMAKIKTKPQSIQTFLKNPAELTQIISYWILLILETTLFHFSLQFRFSIYLKYLLGLPFCLLQLKEHCLNSICILLKKSEQAFEVGTQIYFRKIKHDPNRTS